MPIDYPGQSFGGVFAWVLLVFHGFFGFCMVFVL